MQKLICFIISLLYLACIHLIAMFENKEEVNSSKYCNLTNLYECWNELSYAFYYYLSNLIGNTSMLSSLSPCVDRDVISYKFSWLRPSVCSIHCKITQYINEKMQFYLDWGKCVLYINDMWSMDWILQSLKKQADFYTVRSSYVWI